MKRGTPVLAAVLSFAVLLDARQDQAVCGTHTNRWREDLHLHQSNTRAAGAKFRALSATSRRQLAAEFARPDRGDIAILTDSGGVVTRRNSFDLSEKSIRFTRTSSGAYRFTTSDSGYDAAAAGAGELIHDLTDDDGRAFDLAFEFPFYGSKYRRVFVNSDGNLTFGEADATHSERSLGRLTAGLPRIAPLFRDLDPERADDGVRVLSESGRFVVSWVDVPEYVQTGRGFMQTFQVSLYPDGRVEFAYASVATRNAVVGLSPGRAKGSADVVDFAASGTAEQGGPIAERFSDSEEIDIFTAAQKFYLNHDDSFDYLVLYNAMGVRASDDALAYEVTVRNGRSGYGDAPVELGGEAGSPRRLQAILNMGPLNQYPADPSAPLALRRTTGDTPMSVLAHEAGHLFLAYASIRDEDDPDAQPMLGRQGAHWAFTFNSEASLLEGNRIRDNGQGANPRFTTVGTVEGFSPLDQYLMGFIPKEEVPPTFLVRGAGVNTTRPPEKGVGFNGQREDVSVDDVIAAVGRRAPDHTVSQRKFRFAFVLIVPEGREPEAAELEQVDRLRDGLPAFFTRATSGNAEADVRLLRAVHVSAAPAAGVVAGASATVTISLDAPAAEPLRFALRTTGLVAAPAEVTVPDGRSEASFEVSGLRSGVDELVLEPADVRYEKRSARIQVSAGTSLQLQVVAGDQQVGEPGQPLPAPVTVRLTDINNLPYRGVTVQASPSPGGSVSAARAVTDESGAARFAWTPGPQPNHLTLTASTGATATVTTSGLPVLWPSGIVNAASFGGTIAAGSIAVARGANLRSGADAAQLLINGVPATVLASAADQIRFYVPYAAAGESVFIARTAAGSSAPVRLNVAAVAPGIFFDPATGFGAVVAEGAREWTSVTPAEAGKWVDISATGLGQANAASVQVLLGGEALTVSYVGPADGEPGLNRIRARIPENAASGLWPLVVEVNGVRSNTVQVRIAGTAVTPVDPSIPRRRAPDRSQGRQP